MKIKSQTVVRLCVLLSTFKVSGNKYCRQKVSGSIDFKLFTIFSTTYGRISPQTVFFRLTFQASGYVYVHCTH